MIREMPSDFIDRHTGQTSLIENLPGSFSPRHAVTDGDLEIFVIRARKFHLGIYAKDQARNRKPPIRSNYHSYHNSLAFKFTTRCSTQPSVSMTAEPPATLTERRYRASPVCPLKYRHPKLRLNFSEINAGIELVLLLLFPLP